MEETIRELRALLLTDPQGLRADQLIEELLWWALDAEGTTSQIELARTLKDLGMETLGNDPAEIPIPWSAFRAGQLTAIAGFVRLKLSRQRARAAG